MSRFNKVFVMANTGTELVTDNTKTPYDLTSGQVGLFKVDQNEIVGTGTGATPDPAVIRKIQIHQNLGDNKFATVRTKTIDVTQVVRYYKGEVQTELPHIKHIGYNGVSTATDLVVPVIEAGRAYADVFFQIKLYSKKLKRWYSFFNDTLFIRITSADTRDTFAAKIIAALNGTDKRPFDIAGGNELAAHIVATKITTGTLGMPDYRVGVRLQTVAIPEDPIPTVTDPTYEREVTTFEISEELTYTVTSQVITDSQNARGGAGWAAELASKEMESQGYDRVREFFGDIRYMKQNPFIIRAVFGTKYDQIFLDYNWTHDTPGGHPQTITEPYTVQIAGPATTLQATADVLNTWLAGRFPAITF